MRDDPDYRAWVERGRAVSVETAAAYVRFQPMKGYEKATERMGPCPVCNGRDGFAINTTKNVWNCRKGGAGGKDGVGLVMHCLGLNFPDAIERLIGPPPDDAAKDAAERAARAAAAQAELKRIREENERDAEERAKASDKYREKERLWARNAWKNAGREIDGTPAEIYCSARGLYLPPGLRIRWNPDWPLFDRNADGKPIEVHRGPAIFLPILRPDGYFDGLHATWFDPARPGEKIYVTNAKGERVPAKKVRGLKKGNHIRLSEPTGFTRLFVGEGFETVLSPFRALSVRISPLLAGSAWWTSVDLGNLAGKATDRMMHPTETFTDKAGRTRRRQIPGTEPDMSDHAMVVPDQVTDLYLIGDGDSEPVRTRNALKRAAHRISGRDDGFSSSSPKTALILMTCCGGAIVSHEEDQGSATDTPAIEPTAESVAAEAESDDEGVDSVDPSRLDVQAPDEQSGLDEIADLFELAEAFDGGDDFDAGEATEGQEAPEPAPASRDAGAQGKRRRHKLDRGGTFDRGLYPYIHFRRLRAAAHLDQSDTDNAIRLRMHRGSDIRVLAQEGAQRPTWIVWTGTHWNATSGQSAAFSIAQSLGALIKQEIHFIQPSPSDAYLIEQAETARRIAVEDRGPDEKNLISFADKLMTFIGKRRAERMKFAITSKNDSRLKAMLAGLAPHVLVEPKKLRRSPLQGRDADTDAGICAHRRSRMSGPGYRAA